MRAQGYLQGRKRAGSTLGNYEVPPIGTIYPRLTQRYLGAVLGPDTSYIEQMLGGRKFRGPAAAVPLQSPLASDLVCLTSIAAGVVAMYVRILSGAARFRVLESYRVSMASAVRIVVLLAGHI
jgi:hypothetical protein